MFWRSGQGRRNFWKDRVCDSKRDPVLLHMKTMNSLELSNAEIFEF
jgi:hypothetical protein